MASPNGIPTGEKVIITTHPAYQSFRNSSSIKKNGKDSDDEPLVDKYFKMFPYLQEELKVCILSYVADAPLETLPGNYPKATLTHSLPIVNRQLRNLSNADLFWKDALTRVATREPGLWTEGLRRTLLLYRGGGDEQGDEEETKSPEQTETLANLIKRVYNAAATATATAATKSPAFSIYKTIYATVLNRHLRFTGPVFFMPGQVALGQTYGLHLFEYRYRLLIAEVMKHQPALEARQGGRLSGDPVYFLHANRAPLEPTTPAVLVQVLQCTMFRDGRADVVLMPVHYVWLESIWVRPDSGHLYYAQALKMGKTVTQQMQLLQRQEALANVMDRLAGQLSEAQNSNSSDDWETSTTSLGNGSIAVATDSDHSSSSNNREGDEFV